MSKQLVIIAGEESGDMHAATLVRQIKIENLPIKISGIGGKHLQDAGVDLISDLARYGVTGLSEVIRHARVIKKAFTAIKAHLLQTKPDLLILVDYPGFNLRLAQFAKQQNIRVLYYISPQVWAWKAKRIQTIRTCVDHMAVIFPFEKTIYQQAGIPVSFVGHPLTKEIKQNQSMGLLREHFNLPGDKQVIAILPGSRLNEIQRHMPVLVDTMKQLRCTREDLHFIIPIASSVNPKRIKSYFNQSDLPVSYSFGKSREVMACSDAIIVASGTASLEAALLGKPMCIIYKASLLTYLAASKLIKVKYLGLCNLLQNKLIVPEFLQYDCNAKEIARFILHLLNTPNSANAMLEHLCNLKLSLSAGKADCTLLDLVKKEINLF